MVSEKVGGAEGTKLDEDFKELEKVQCAITSDVFLRIALHNWVIDPQFICLEDTYKVNPRPDQYGIFGTEHIPVFLNRLIF